MPKSQKPRKKRKKQEKVLKSQDDVIERSHQTPKNYVYKKNGIKLDFTLRVDIPEELTIFKELMVEGIKDIDGDLAKLEESKKTK